MKALLLCALFVSGVQAATFKIDSASSKAGFEIVKFKIGAKVPGEFKQFSGTADVDEKKNEISKVSVTIQTASVATGEEKRDNHLKSPDFFDVAKYPTMTFMSSAPAKIANTFDLKGKLTIKGVTKDVVLKVNKTLTKDKPHSFVATTQINRLDYGVTWNKTMEESDWKTVLGKLGKVVLADEVDIILNVQLVP